MLWFDVVESKTALGAAGFEFGRELSNRGANPGRSRVNNIHPGMKPLRVTWHGARVARSVFFIMQASGLHPTNDIIPIDSRRLLMFCVVAEVGTVAEAARRLCLTRSALSHALKTLEGDLGCTLFDRRERSIAITEAGRRLLPQGRRILEAMNLARASLSE